MRLQDDDDDDSPSWRRDRYAGESFEENPDDADLADEQGGVKCVHCGRTIHEHAELCPYCKHWQSDEHPTARKQRWFVVTVFLLVGALSGILWIVLALLNRRRP
jgi:predicted nucleic acid-binding Zn ribbon protein